MTLHADLKDPVEIGRGPFGTRVVYDVTGGEFSGPRLRGRLLASGGDWLVTDDGGVGRLDVRATLETGDGALVYVQYYGVVVLNEAVAGAMERGEPTDFGDTHFMTQPRFETGDERYAWLNRVVAIAEGRVLPGAVEYRIFEAVQD